jgi:hypothetical protein
MGDRSIRLSSSRMLAKPSSERREREGGRQV